MIVRNLFLENSNLFYKAKMEWVNTNKLSKFENVKIISWTFLDNKLCFVCYNTSMVR